MTVAMSLLIHGEAVRFNRGQSRGDDFDFKYMRGRDGREYPYVSSQCYKKYWREALHDEPLSPIIRAKDSSGKDKNQAYTSGNPIKYLDDDLFGYMIAGASEDDNDSDEMDLAEPGDDVRRIFTQDNIKDLSALRRKLMDASPMSEFILGRDTELRKSVEGSTASSTGIEEAILNALDEAARSGELEVKLAKAPQKRARGSNQADLWQHNKKLLMKAFSKELQDTPKRATEKRTAPVRMHALVAFSGIKTAKDFQTFSRDVAYTGANSVMNPNKPGFYSAWLKTRILVESHRIGKFYVGENMDILPDKANGMEIKRERNPYSPRQQEIDYIQLDSSERTRRLRAILKALANIGNTQGPASGALHDGSLRPKGFIAGMMNCADSPFDYVWAGHNDDRMPYLDVGLLRDSVMDWQDLFASKTIFVGLPIDSALSVAYGGTTGGAATAPAAEIKTAIETEMQKIGFVAVVDTPRKALLRLAEEAAV